MPTAKRDDPRVRIVELPPLFATQDLAAYLRVCPAQVREFRAKGRIPPPDLYISNRPRWRPETVAAIVDAGRI